MSVINKDLGVVTAYAYAVEAGYTGTEEEFEQALGDLAELVTDFENFTVEVTTLEPGSSATASYANGVLSLGIPEGEKGDTGATPNLTIGTVTTLAPGSDATAAITGTDKAPVLSLGIPEGDPGEVPAAALASDFSASVSYKKGDYVWKSGTLYEFTADHAAGAWTGSDVTTAKVADDVTALKSAIADIDETVNGQHVTIEYVNGEYVGTNGAFVTYATWSRTNFIPVPNDGNDLLYSNSGASSAYCAFYSAENTESFVSTFSIQKTENGNISIPAGAEYFIVSNYTVGIKSFNYKNPPVSAGLVDVVNDITEKMPETPKVVMCDKLVALVDEQFDVHYDNIFVNYRGKDIPYIELFGNVTGVGMQTLMRLKSTTVASGVTGAIRYRNYIPDAFNSPSLPSNVLRKAFSVDTIATTAGSGVTRKVLLIGDSWTAPGVYARELRTLFADNDEPMNITLLGTLGDGGAYVGPESGYHEGHGAYSAKTFCTKATYNTYANAFFNPTSETFDFTYYMTQCGYTSVDDVFINLGINDVAETADFDEIIEYWDTIIDSIKDYDANIKIFIGLCGLPAQYKYGISNNHCNREKARRLMFHERLMQEYGNRESENLIIVPLHLSIDTEHDFPSTQAARSYRDNTLVDYCTDYVHPNTIAYNKIADRIRTYIKYAETLS